MPYSYSYLQVNIYKRFDGAVSITVVSITVVLKESENKVEGSSPSKIYFYFLFFAFAKMQEITFRDLHVCRKTCFDVLYTCKATSLSEMTKLVWR